MKKHKTRNLTITSCMATVLALFLFLSIAACANNPPADLEVPASEAEAEAPSPTIDLIETLTQAQIDALRSEFPIYTQTNPLVEMLEQTPEETFEDSVYYSDTIVLANVIGDVSYYNSGYDWTEDPALVALAEQFGEEAISSLFDRYEYPLEIISDTEGIFLKGTRITITRNRRSEDYEPTPEIGTTIITPVIKGEHKDDTRFGYGRNGFFYVTEDGFALSAFEEAPKYRRSGVRAEALMGQMREWKRDITRERQRGGRR